MCFVVGPPQTVVQYTIEELKALKTFKDVNKNISPLLHELNIYQRPSTRRNTRAGLKCPKQIPICHSNIANENIAQTGVNTNNLIHVTTTSESSGNTVLPLLDFSLLNARSVRNKCQAIKDYVVDNDIDVLAITETWLSTGDGDACVIADLCPNGYKFSHRPRGSKGGGVGILYKSSLSIKIQKVTKYKSFEHVQYILKSASKCFRICVVYRPPPSKKNKLTPSMFLEEFSAFLDELSQTSGQLVLLGDFTSDNVAFQFNSLIDSLNLTQHVSEGTHNSGHTLDLVITRSSETTISDIHVDAPVLSDHSAVKFKLSSEKTSCQKKSICYRKLRDVDTDLFKSEIAASPLLSSPCHDINQAVSQYNTILQELLDKHAPVIRRTVTVRPSAAWYNDAIKDAKRVRRQLERRWRRTKLTVYKEKYKEQCKIVIKLIEESRQKYYNAEVKSKAGDQKALFKVLDNLLHRKKESALPSHNSKADLANTFADFFVEKIEKIRSDLNLYINSNGLSQENESHLRKDFTIKLQEFSEATEEEILKIIKSSASKSCDLDPIPTWLLKECTDALLPVITHIVNLSLSSCEMPKDYKEALLIPLLKKAILDSEILKNFRPVSNLAYLSKLIEKIVAARLLDHMTENELHEYFQSAYKKFHSTETALTKVQNDILTSLDNNYAVLLILLDLSAAFDTIDHKVLLELLHTRIGVCGKALQWFKSYLAERKQTILINGVRSECRDLKYGVPQGSVLGPILFTIYMLPLGDIIRKLGLNFHIYADDTQLYLSFAPSSSNSREACKEKMEQCVCKIREWMAQNFLKLNDDKTEVVLISSDKSLHKTFPPVKVGNEIISCSQDARNIGVIFDSKMNMESHVNNVSKIAHFHIRNIGRIRKFLTKEAAETLVHAFISSRLDYCNALLYGLPAHQISKLQKIQNTAARIVTNTRKFDHITPVLKALHWLPIYQRIKFKILLLTFKALHGCAPSYLVELITLYRPARSLRSEQECRLIVPKFKTHRFGERAFVNSAPSLWNALPNNIRNLTSVASFKKNLKTHLFREAYD